MWVGFFRNQKAEKINDRSELWAVLNPPLGTKWLLEGALMPHHYAAATRLAPSRLHSVWLNVQGSCQC